MKPIRMTVLVAVTCFGTTANADWESSLLPHGFSHQKAIEQAVAEGKRTTKPVIVYYTRTNCPPCNVLKGILRSEPTAGIYRERYIFTAVWGSSMGHTERERYRSLYNVQGAPTWLFFNSDGDYVCTAHGGFSTADGAKLLNDSVQNLLKSSVNRTSPEPRSCT